MLKIRIRALRIDLVSIIENSGTMRCCAFAEFSAVELEKFKIVVDGTLTQLAAKPESSLLRSQDV
jgi:hypothetical protein